MPDANSGRLELILVYTGNGKGKTSACIGQAIRSLGQNMTVGFAQFIKRDHVAGEQIILKTLLGDKFRAGGVGFYKREKHEEHYAKAQDLLQWAFNLQVQMLVLDEAIYALNYGLISEHDIQSFLEQRRGQEAHVVLSGRNAPEWLLNMAQIATVMEDKKHICREGIWQVKGIEY